VEKRSNEDYESYDYIAFLQVWLISQFIIACNHCNNFRTTHQMELYAKSPELLDKHLPGSTITSPQIILRLGSHKSCLLTTHCAFKLPHRYNFRNNEHHRSAENCSERLKRLKTNCCGH